MKKSILMISAAFLAFSVSMHAQEAPQVVQPAEASAEQQEEQKVPEYKYFNHLGIGLSGLIMDGPSISLATPIGPYFQLRAGYSTLSPFWAYKQNFDLSSTVSYGTRDFSNIPVKLELTSSFYGLVDLYPSKKHAFHFTLGAFYSNKGDLFNASADLRGVLTEFEYANLEVTVKSDGASDEIEVTSDKEGFLRVGIQAKQQIRPYIGLGWGRGANIKHRVSVSFDLGLQYMGGLGAYVTNFKTNEDSYVTSSIINHNDKVENAPIIGTQEDIIDQLKAGKLFFGSWWPVMKFGINVRLF